MAWFYEIRTPDNTVLKCDGGFPDQQAVNQAAPAEENKMRMSRRPGRPGVDAFWLGTMLTASPDNRLRGFTEGTGDAR
jgi:hypothetical protein